LPVPFSEEINEVSVYFLTHPITTFPPVMVTHTIY